MLRALSPTELPGGRAAGPTEEPLDLTPLGPLLAGLEEQLQPIAVWLFGSRARRTATASSDWDLLVVVRDDLDERTLDPRTGWHIARRAGVRADVVLCGETDFREARETCNTLAYEVARSGVVIRER